MAPGVIDLHTCQSTFLAHAQLAANRTARIFPSELLPNQAVPSRHRNKGLFLPMAGIHICLHSTDTSYTCGTSVHGLVGKVVLGWRLDLILEVFSNLNNSVILWFYDSISWGSCWSIPPSCLDLSENSSEVPQKFCCITITSLLRFGPGRQKKGHAVVLLPPSPLGWGGECKETGKTRGSGWGQFNRTANKANSSNNNTDTKSKQNKQRSAQSYSHWPVRPVLPRNN